MKKLLLNVFLLFAFVGLMANDGYDLQYKQGAAGSATLQFTIQDYGIKTVTLDGTVFSAITFDSKVTTKEKGFAELPFINANIQLDPVKNMNMQVSALSFVDFQVEAPLVPSRGVIYRDQDPSTIPYTIAPESITDSFYPAEVATFTEPFIIKDVRGATVYIYPFSYNAVAKTVRVYTNIEVTLTPDNSAPVNPLFSTTGKYFPAMESLYSSVFLNYENQLDVMDIAETGDILVITTARDEAAIQPYIDWKMEKGFEVFKEVVAAGTNVKSLIQQKYNENNEILYVQLVGDWADIKCDLGGGANAPMDPMLGCVVGTDYFPEIAIGRFSASNPAQVTVQVNKSITYEKNPSGDWYNNAIGIASNQGPGDDGELDYQQLDVIWANKLDPFTYDNISTAYDPTGTSTMVKNYVEQGASIINYIGHGSQNSWGSTGFSSTNVNSLTNGDKLPFIFSVACVNGAFHSGDCFAEAWLRKENGGAIMTLMATINQPWDPPMRGQDYFNDILTGGYNYTTGPGNGINTDEGRTIIGSIVANGLVLMYTESNSSSDLQTVQTWTTFGDAALQIRTDEPAPVTVSNNVMLVGADFETTINLAGAPFEGALVALSQDDMYASAYSDENGFVSVPNNFLPGDVRLVVTAFNGETIYETIQCIPPTGPYVIFNQVAVNTPSGKLVYGETSMLSLAMKNVGVANATNVVVTISTDDEYVTITDNTENFGTIAPDAIITIENAFAVEVANDVPDGHSVAFNVIATGNEIWESTFALTATAGVLEFGEFYIMDINGNNNGKLDPGESASIVVSINNSGAAMADQVMGELTSSDMYLTINTASMSYGTLGAGESVEAEFEVIADEATPTGHLVNFDFEMTADKGLTATNGFMIVVGQIPVLIIDMDENHNSANKMAEALDEIGLPYDEATTLPDDLNLYSSIFLTLGIYSNNATLSNADGQKLADYLNAGGNLYMEGGDTWAYDTPTAVHGMFGLDGTSDGSSDLSTVVGVAGTFTAGMSMVYSGDNNWIDHLAATTGTLILNNQSPLYGTAVANDGGVYKTVGASHEFGGLAAGSRTSLMEAYLDFFDMMPSTLVSNFTANATEGCAGMEVTFTDASVGAVSWSWTFPGGTPETSTEQNPVVIYNTKGDYDVTLEISDGTDTQVMTKTNYIHVDDVPAQAGQIDGDLYVGNGEMEMYQIELLDDCTIYDWVLTPEEAGTMSMNMNEVEITWSQTYVGNATLKVCGGNDCGMGAYSDGLDIMVMDPTGINDISAKAVNVYPNPTTGIFNLQLNATQETNYELTLTNALGRQVITETLKVNGAATHSIDLSDMAQGVYYLYIRSNSGTIIEKIIKE
jgi:PKD repeat protein